jgi:hypothetical protein
MASRNLTPEGAQKLEEGLKAEPNDVDSHSILVGYYFMAGIQLKSDKSEIEKKRLSHVFWLIENCPDAETAGSPEARIDAMGRRGLDDYRRGRQLWLQQVEKHPVNVAVLRNAASYCTLWDDRIARELLERVLQLAPADPHAVEMLAQSYAWERMRTQSPEERARLAQKSLFLRERALEPIHGLHRFYALDDVAVAALEAGDTGKAHQYASELLKTAEEHRSDWNYGNAIHKANIVLGRISLYFGDVAGAKKHLQAAGETPGSPQLNSFGPNMTLAKELLEKGETEAVLAYLQACSKFWAMGGDRLKSWMSTVKSGGKPVFGANLDY